MIIIINQDSHWNSSQKYNLSYKGNQQSKKIDYEFTKKFTTLAALHNFEGVISEMSQYRLCSFDNTSYTTSLVRYIRNRISFNPVNEIFNEMYNFQPIYQNPLFVRECHLRITLFGMELNLTRPCLSVSNNSVVTVTLSSVH